MTSRPLIALLAGTVFGVGLAVSQMINPQKVLSFLHLGPSWDPSLALVLAAALAVSFAGHRLTKGRSKPVFDDRFHLPDTTRVDARLMLGAVIFGLGWGLAGYCPGPALAALATGSWEAPVFVVAMILGSTAHDLLDRLRQRH